MKKDNFIILRIIYNFISDFYNLFRSILNILHFSFVYCVERRSTAQYGGDLVTLRNVIFINKK